MKLYTIITLFSICSIGHLSAFRGSRSPQAYPSTRAEQLMRNYTPQPYPLERGSHSHRRFDRGFYPSYGSAVVGVTDDYPYTEATNQPEHLGID